MLQKLELCFLVGSPHTTIPLKTYFTDLDFRIRSWTKKWEAWFGKESEPRSRESGYKKSGSISSGPSFKIEFGALPNLLSLIHFSSA